MIQKNINIIQQLKPCLEINKEQQISLNNRQIVSIKRSHYQESFHVVKDNFEKPLSKENIRIISSPDLNKNPIRKKELESFHKRHSDF